MPNLLKLSIILALSCSSLFAKTIDLTISGIENNRGVVQVAVWKSADGFPEEYQKAVKLLTLKLDNLKDVKLEGLKPGTYAIAVYHDENEDVILNRGAFGIPKEGVGFSRNPRLRFGPPAFSKCAVSLADTPLKVSISLRYP